LRRVILAFAARTASVLVGFCFGFGVLTPPTAGILGSAGVGITEPRSIGWVLIGPGVGLSFGILANSFPPILFSSRQSPTV
jgi:hypothetical protein